MRRVPAPGRQRGSMLVAALLLSSLLLIMGMAMLGIQSRGYSASVSERDALQAKLLAVAGVEDATLKLSKDVGFPPPAGGRRTFAYAEDVFDPETGDPIGFYRVQLDVSQREPPAGLALDQTTTYDYPNCIIRIDSRGYVARRGERPRAMRRIYAEIDASPKARGAPVTGPTPDQPSSSVTEATRRQFYTNSNFNRLIRWEDEGSL